MKIRFCLLVVLLGAALFVAAAYALTASEILAQSEALEHCATRTADYTMTITSKGGKNHVFKFTVVEKQSAGGARKTLRVTEPANHKGLALLTWRRRGAADQQWLLRPGKKRARELDAGDRSDDFLDSDLSFADLGFRLPENADNQVLQQVLYDAKQCYLVESHPLKGVESAYTYWRTWVDVANLVTVKTEFYNKKGKLVRTIAANKTAQIDGRWTVTQWEARTDLRSNAKTVITLDKATYDADVPDNALTPDGLPNL